MEQWNGIMEFVAAVDHGAMSKAAKALGVSPSHITKRINLLEERIRMKLLARSTRALSLTEIGEKYYQSVKPIINALEQ